MDTFYVILFFAVLAAVAFIMLAVRGEGGHYAEKDYNKKKSNPFDSPMF